MTRTCVISLPRFAETASIIASATGAEYLPYEVAVFERAFSGYSRIIALMSSGIAVRGIAPLLRDKWTDPPVVLVSPDMRYAVPLVGGHHGANDLARELATLGIEPVITTATETAGRPSVEGIARSNGCDVVNRAATRPVNAALLDGDVPFHRIRGPAMVIAEPEVAVLVREGTYVVGIGCRRGAAAHEVEEAVREVLALARIGTEDVLVYATTEKKKGEVGLVDAVRQLGGVLVYVDDDTINSQRGTGPSRAPLIGLKGVAEPAALAVSRHGDIVLGKTVRRGVTVAITR
ncbi:MAG: cobalamin biosynthesis protein CbiG [Methanoculleus sp. SDB]|nr:MAG: cobalamin biosynthesis protein CbiG [Methanoculleus sp. SDB]